MPHTDECRRSLRARFLLSLLLLLPILTSAAYGGDPARQILRIEGTSATDNRLLLDLGFDVAAVRPGEWTDILAAPGDAERLERLGYPTVSMGSIVTAIPSEYHTYAEMVTALQQMVTAHPTIARLEDLGDSWGRIYNDPDYVPHDIWGLKISDNVQLDEAEPEILYTGVHHAREPVTLEICLGIANELLSRYGVDPTITRYVNDHETWIVPLQNPDGHWCVTDKDYTDWRKNCRDNDGNGRPTAPTWWWYPDGVDTNRNYAWHWGGDGSDSDPNSETYRGPSAFSEPENQAIRSLALRENFAFSIDYHSYGEEVLYPYGYDNSSNAPDEQMLSSIATTIRDRIGGNYVAMQANQLYPAAGNSQDWHYGEYNCFAYIIETATEFIPPGSAIAGIVTPNVRGAMYLQERIDGPGVRGIVRINGTPGLATVTLVGVDNPSMAHSRESHPVTGDYYRITSSGDKTLRFSATGFPDQEFVVSVPTSGYATLDVDFGVSDVATGTEAVGLRLDVTPNPAQESAGLRYALPKGTSSADLSIFDLSGRLVTQQTVSGAQGLTLWDGRDGSGRRMPTGIYLARITAGADARVRRIVLLP